MRPLIGSRKEPIPLLPGQPGIAIPRLIPAVDGTVALTGYLILLFLLPARLVFAPFGGAGHPASLVAVGLATTWFWARSSRAFQIPDPQPMRGALFAYLMVLLASVVVGLGRGMPIEETRSAGRFLLATIAACGIALMASDFVKSRHRLDVLLLRLVYGGGFLAFLGQLQFFFGIDLASKLRLPGLTSNSDLLGISARGDVDLRRVAGTANHFIEFGVVLALILPIAIHYALHSPSRAKAQARWGAVLMISLAVPFSISRSAILAAGVVLLTLVGGWTWRRRLNGAVILVGFLAVVRTAVPGLLGTISALFLNTSNDPSVQGRTDDYAIVTEYIVQRPWLGRGAATFTPERYILLDNQILGTLVTTGVVGLATFLGLFLVGIHLNGSTRRRTLDPASIHLTYALTGTIGGAFVASLTFDSLAFNMFTGIVFLILGASAGLRNLATDPGVTPLTRPRRDILKARR